MQSLESLLAIAIFGSPSLQPIRHSQRVASGDMEQSLARSTYYMRICG